jgi:hypothetical protein
VSNSSAAAAAASIASRPRVAPLDRDGVRVTVF